MSSATNPHGNTAGRPVEEVTTERGADYGSPLAHFNTTRNMFSVWERRRDESLKESKGPVKAGIENVLRHVVYMICDKLARLATNPHLMDGWSDIKGYAHCFEKAVGVEIEEEPKAEPIGFIPLVSGSMPDFIWTAGKQYFKGSLWGCEGYLAETGSVYTEEMPISCDYEEGVDFEYIYK